VSPARRAMRADLIRLGQQPVRGPSLAFTARLERQLVGDHDDHAGATVLALPARRRLRLVPVLTSAAATIAVVFLAGALFGVFDHGAATNLRLGPAVNTTVRLPGGRTVAGRTGLQLPNGAVVRTGPNGRAAAGTVQLGPGLEGIVDNHGLRIQLPTAPPPVNVPPVTIPALPGVPPIKTPPVTLPLGLGH